MQSRTTNNLGGDGGDRSSVKLHHAPGGKSNFSLGWDTENQQSNQYGSGKQTGGYGSYGTASNTQAYGQSYGGASQQENQSYGGKYDQRNKDNSKPSPFATDDSPTKTSVKVHHAPGGQSNFSLGNEPTDYGRRGGEGRTDDKTSVKVHAPPGGKSNFKLG